ncbi:MAG: hypothetical protein LBK67_11465 [Coriobacteriales bacterium]|jgi:hypothetical protein|nr:hypothetical protein [Coriobacteriales bacterium]
MKITIKDKNGKPSYEIRTAPGGLCFELFSWKPERIGKKKGNVCEAGFVSQGRYPTTLSHALRSVAESITKDLPERFDAVPTQEGLRILSAQIDHMLDSFGVEIVDSMEPNE